MSTPGGAPLCGTSILQDFCRGEVRYVTSPIADPEAHPHRRQAQLEDLRAAQAGGSPLGGAAEELAALREAPARVAAIATERVRGSSDNASRP